MRSLRIICSFLLTAFLASAAPQSADLRIPLSEAVITFNQQAAGDPIGKDQAALTEEAVVAAIRWEMLDRKKLLVSDETFRTLSEIIETRWLPKGFQLEKHRGYEPNDQVTFDVWSVRLRIPGGTLPGGTTCITIQEKMIASRRIGDEERKVIHEWKKRERERGGIGSFERVDWMQRYRAERERAAAIDREKQ